MSILHDYQIGDLVVILDNLEWDNVSAITGEIGIVIEIFEPDDQVNFFDLLLQLADGGLLPVWLPEVEKII